MSDTRIILDVDTGIDDALAILYALARPGVRVEGLTTVHGNIDVESTTRNTLQVLELAGRSDIPVAKGCANPLTGTYVRRVRPHGDSVHGDNGLGGVELPLPRTAPVAQHAVDFIIDTVRKSPGQITLVPVGRMTNVALAILQAPDIVAKVKSCVIMGGAATVMGNSTAVAEANIYGDPEAARILFRSGMPVVMVGLDVTMQTVLTPDGLERLAREGGRVGRVAASFSRHYLNVYLKYNPHLGGCALHDPLAVEVAADPSIVRIERLPVDVECQGELTRGMTVADRRRRSQLTPNIDVCLGVDARRFEAMFLERLISLKEL